MPLLAQRDKNVGAWAAYALPRGDDLDDALAFVRASALYSSAISSLASPDC